MLRELLRRRWFSPKVANPTPTPAPVLTPQERRELFYRDMLDGYLTKRPESERS